MIGFLSIVVLMASIVVAVLSNKDKSKQLTVWQNIGIVLSFIIAIAVGTVLIYYGGNWFVGFIANDFLKKAAFFTIVILIWGFIMSGISKIVKLISCNVYKNSDVENTSCDLRCIF